MDFRPFDWAGRMLRRGGEKLLERSGSSSTWIDVGAHNGETTLRYAMKNPRLRVFAFEPNLAAAVQSMGRAANYFVVPAAVAEHDGVARFYINAADVASSLLPLNEETAPSWIGGEVLKIDSVVTVPTVRLDTFLNTVGIDKVDFLKVDAQGADLAVVRSAGSRLKDIRKVTLEVDITPKRLYKGSAGRDEIVAFMKTEGFVLSETQMQSRGQEEDLTFVSARGEAP
jgi:FkbM family methyltransferase